MSNTIGVTRGAGLFPLGTPVFASNFRWVYIFHLSIYISARLSFRVIIAATICVQKWCSGRLLLFFVRGHVFFVICIQ